MKAEVCEREEGTIGNKVFKCSLIIIAIWLFSASTLFLGGGASITEIIRARMYGYNSTDWDKTIINSNTNALVTMNSNHNDVHDGKGYTLTNVDEDLDINEYLNLTITTPNNGESTHLFFSGECTTSAHIELWESFVNTTVGTPINAYNRNRNSTNTHKVLLYDGQTGDGTGTLLWEYHIGADRKVGGDTSDNEGWILNANTVYLLLIRGGADNGKASVIANFFEE